jgi:hypothetical protein
MHSPTRIRASADAERSSNGGEGGGDRDHADGWRCGHVC